MSRFRPVADEVFRVHSTVQYLLYSKIRQKIRANHNTDTTILIFKFRTSLYYVLARAS